MKNKKGNNKNKNPNILLKIEKILNNIYFRLFLAVILFLIVYFNVHPEGLSDIVYFLWSCEIMTLLLIVNLTLFNNYKLYFFIFLITWTSTFEWVIDFFKMLAGFSAPKTEWMLYTQEPIIWTTIQHALIIILPTIYTFFYLKKSKTLKIYKTLVITSMLTVIYYFILAFISYDLSLKGIIPLAENINCVLRECGSSIGLRNQIELIFYVFYYIKNLIILDLILLLVIFRREIKRKVAKLINFLKKELKRKEKKK
ncbi:MAG: hypothetical protein ABGW69_01395 [Nanoarchaeota archaeon]